MAMSELLDRLREICGRGVNCANKGDCEDYENCWDHRAAIIDRIDAEHEITELQKESYLLDLKAANIAVGEAYKRGYDEGFASADDWLAQHEDAMAEHGWVKGPLDADGEMWRSGDMSDSNWGVIEGIAYENGRWFITGHDMSAPWVPADSIRHYHAPTVEDVLRQVIACANNGMHVHGALDTEQIVAEYAAKLQLREDA